jgi:hypothetical protein
LLHLTSPVVRTIAVAARIRRYSAMIGG